MSSRTPTRRRPTRRVRPLLERLEGRDAPAVSTVNTLLDTAPAADANLTLREALLVNTHALQAADVVDADHTSLITGAVGDHDSIQFSVSGILSLASALPTLTADVSIEGPSATALTVQRDTAAAHFGVLVVNSGVTADLSGLTISGGYWDSGSGGGIHNEGS